MNRRVILMMAIFLGVFCFGIKKNAFADCSRTVKFDQNNDGIINNETKTAERYSGKSVCDYKNTDNNLNITLSSPNRRYICDGNGGWTKQDCNASQVCVETIDTNDLKNSTAECQDISRINCGEKDIDGKQIEVKLNYGLCVDNKHYGICTSDKSIKYIQSCPNEGTCIPDANVRYIMDTREFNYGQYALYQCAKPCIKYGITLNEGEKHCFINDVLFQGKKTQVEECKKGKLEVIDTCTDDEECLMWPDKTKAECHSKSLSDMCTKTSDNDENIPDGLVDISLCYGNNAYKCEQIPTWTMTGNCGTDKKCYRDVKTEWVATCLTDQEAGKLGITISTTTSDGFWCKDKGNGTEYIKTAIGCMPIDINDLVATLLPSILGIAGGIAFLMMVYGFIMVSTSSGDEKKLQEAQKIITSAITGLLVAIFSLFIYKLIAVDILHIPGIN